MIGGSLPTTEQDRLERKESFKIILNSLSRFLSMMVYYAPSQTLLTLILVVQGASGQSGNPNGLVYGFFGMLAVLAWCEVFLFLWIRRRPFAGAILPATMLTSYGLNLLGRDPTCMAAIPVFGVALIPLRLAEVRILWRGYGRGHDYAGLFWLCTSILVDLYYAYYLLKDYQLFLELGIL